MIDMHDEAGFDMRIWTLAHDGSDDELQRHIAGCESCQHELATLRELARFARTTGGVDIEPPPSLLTRMSGLMSQVRPDLLAHQQDAMESRVMETVRRVLATLVFDSGASLQPAGLRGAADSRTRQIVFESDVADLDLELSRSEDDANAWSLVGQLGMDTMPSALTVSFVPTGNLAASRTAGTDAPGNAIRMDISTGGHFRGAIPPGSWTAVVEIGDAEVRFGEIRV